MEETEQPKEQPLNLVEEAKLIRDEIIKQKEELRAEREKLERVRSDQILAGDTGGRVETPKITEEERKINEAKEFWKGTAIADDIKRANNE